MQLDRIAVSQIIKDCIAPSFKSNVIEKLRQSKFDIQFDESTDVSQIQSGCIILKFLDFNLRKVATNLWKIVPVLDEYDDDHEANAARLYEKITATFTEENVPLNNVAAFASDGCSTMMGAHNSVSQRFQQNNPTTVIVKCPSHSIHFCAENAMKQLPNDIVKFCSAIYKFFSRSPKRQHTLVEFQVFLDTEIHKMLRPSSTRWLSLEASISRIIEQYFTIIFYACFIARTY